jgi:hypothetical protein
LSKVICRSVAARVQRDACPRYRSIVPRAPSTTSLPDRLHYANG